MCVCVGWGWEGGGWGRTAARRGRRRPSSSPSKSSCPANTRPTTASACRGSNTAARAGRVWRSHACRRAWGGRDLARRVVVLADLDELVKRGLRTRQRLCHDTLRALRLLPAAAMPQGARVGGWRRRARQAMSAPPLRNGGNLELGPGARVVQLHWLLPSPARHRLCGACGGASAARCAAGDRCRTLCAFSSGLSKVPVPRGGGGCVARPSKGRYRYIRARARIF